MNAVGLVILFEGAEIRAYPLADVGGSLELTELLPAFCRRVLADQDLVCCLAGLHDADHRPGSCVQ